MAKKNILTVFCASSDGVNPIYAQEAKHLGEVMAAQGRKLVYGAGRRGLMGVVANTVRDNGGYAIGVNITRFKDPRYIMDVDENYITETLQDRKAQLVERGDACVVLAGGIGTLDEMAEVYSMLQLGMSDRPIGILNTNGYYDLLLAFFDKMRDEGFLKRKYDKIFIVRDTVEELLKALDECENINQFD